MNLRYFMRRKIDAGLIYPDYKKWTILNVGRAAKGEKVPDPFELGEHYLVFVVDALGYYMFRRFFGQHDEVYPISSVLPSNTAVAIPALYSGEIPAKRGYYGSFSRENGRVLDLFRVGTDIESAFSVTNVLPAHMRFRRRLLKLKGRTVYYANGFDLKHVLNRLKGSAVVYVVDVDVVAHERGPYTSSVKETAAFYLDILRRVAERWKRVILVSDHGMKRTGKQILLSKLGYGECDAFGDFRAVLLDRPWDEMNSYTLFPDFCARLYGVTECPAKYVVLPSDGTTYYFPGSERLVEKTRGGIHGGATPEELLAVLLSGSGKEVAETLNKILKPSGR